MSRKSRNLRSQFLLLAGLTLGNLQIHAAAPWTPLGPDGGDARRIVADSHDHTHLYLGTANGWIYESHTSGASWVRLAQIGHRDDLVLDSIVLDRSDPQHLLVGAWVLDRPDGGLFASVDGGHTWTNQAEMRGQSVRALTSSPSDPKVYVAGSLAGVFRSLDSGRHWTRISPADSKEIHEIQSVAVDPKDPNIIYAGTWHLPWKTADAGEHWRSIKQGIIDDSDVFSIIVDPLSPQTVYASACSGIYKSDDSGTLFHKIQGIPSTARRTRVLLQDPQHLTTVFAGTTEGLFRSVDAGATWTRTTGPEIIVNDVLVDAADGQHVLIATNRGGVLSSEDGGDTFHSSNGGFSARQITTLQRDRTHPSTLFVGVVNDKEWGGVFESGNGGVNWMQRSEGLQGRDVFSLGQAPDGTIVAGTGHGIYRLDRGENTWMRVDKVQGSASPPSPPRSAATAAAISKQAVTQSKYPGKVTRQAQSASRVSTPKTSHMPSLSRSKHAKAVATRKGSASLGRATATKVGGRAAVLHPTVTRTQNAPAAMPLQVKAPATSFDGGVYSITTAVGTMVAATSSGLLSSGDNGVSWTSAGPKDHSEWHFLASARANVVAGTLHQIIFSADAGVSWSPVSVPQGLTQLSALAVEPSGAIWAGSREGVFLSSDAGNTWTTPKGVYLNPVSSILYDEATSAVTITASGIHGIVFTVHLPEKSISYFEAGWTLRFAYPIGDHLVAATMFDGLVVQPRMTVSPPSQSPSGSSSGVAPPPATSLR